MEDKAYDILTDLLRSDIDKQEAIKKLMAIKQKKRVVNKFKRSESGTRFNK